MRKSVISSSVSTIVAQANDCLVTAGVALRTLLHHTSMRERHFNWHEPMVAREQERTYQRLGNQPSRNPLLSDDTGMRFGMPCSPSLPNSFDNMTNVVRQLWQNACLKRTAQPAYALCPAYAAIARVAQKG
ncbi:MAG: hypothetical protein IT423_23550 [Pirellulaceae bacterium]|nr:hypothetical protein [Pirellulaceae bacterium]